VKGYIRSLKLEERRREIATRTQEDYAVFVSYSHADKETTRRLTVMFDRCGIRYLIDEKELQWTDYIAGEVQERIERSTHYLLILSDASAKSQWCAFEFGLATEANKTLCMVMASPEATIPSFAQPVLATADFGAVEEYFSGKLIDPGAVDRFIGAPR